MTKNDWISFSKNFSFQRQIFLGWAFRNTKRPDKDLLHTPKLIVNKWDKGIETKKAACFSRLLLSHFHTFFPRFL